MIECFTFERALDDGSTIMRGNVVTRVVEAKRDVLPIARPAAIDLIRRAWPSIVGDEVARHSEPVQIAGEALVIRATSKWSHQLSFLECVILRDLADLRLAKVSRLRFRAARVAA